MIVNWTMLNNWTLPDILEHKHLLFWYQGFEKKRLLTIGSPCTVLVTDPPLRFQPTLGRHYINNFYWSLPENASSQISQLYLIIFLREYILKLFVCIFLNGIYYTSLWFNHSSCDHDSNTLYSTLQNDVFKKVLTFLNKQVLCKIFWKDFVFLYIAMYKVNHLICFTLPHDLIIGSSTPNVDAFKQVSSTLSSFWKNVFIPDLAFKAKHCFW